MVEMNDVQVTALTPDAKGKVKATDLTGILAELQEKAGLQTSHIQLLHSAIEPMAQATPVMATALGGMAGKINEIQAAQAAMASEVKATLALHSDALDQQSKALASVQVRVGEVNDRVFRIEQAAIDLRSLVPKKLTEAEQKAADKDAFWDGAKTLGAGVGVVVVGTLLAKAAVAGAEWGYDKLQG